MKVQFNDGSYLQVYWKHLNCGKGNRSFSECYVHSAIPDQNYTDIIASGVAITAKDDAFNRRLGMKISFSRAVAQIQDKETRTILWKEFRKLREPKSIVLYYKGRPHKFICNTTMMVADGNGGNTTIPAVMYAYLYKRADGAKTGVTSRAVWETNFYPDTTEGVQEEIAQVAQTEAELQQQSQPPSSFEETVDTANIPEEAAFNYDEEEIEGSGENVEVEDITILDDISEEEMAEISEQNQNDLDEQD